MPPPSFPALDEIQIDKGFGAPVRAALAPLSLLGCVRPALTPLPLFTSWKLALFTSCLGADATIVKVKGCQETHEAIRLALLVACAAPPRPTLPTETRRGRRRKRVQALDQPRLVVLLPPGGGSRPPRGSRGYKIYWEYSVSGAPPPPPFEFITPYSVAVISKVQQPLR